MQKASVQLLACMAEVSDVARAALASEGVRAVVHDVRRANPDDRLLRRMGRWLLETVPRHTCGQCGVVGERFRKCGRCMSVRYCSVPCQRLAWKTHQRVCVATPPPE